jgi:NADH:ubiquinone oxidoreductase subunit 5 (subunit L)/multisubunit Na+/H+ antiporter MnhA subunit
MNEEENKIRFIGYLTFFTFTMLLLVLSNSLFMIIIG